MQNSPIVVTCPHTTCGKQIVLETTPRSPPVQPPPPLHLRPAKPPISRPPPLRPGDIIPFPPSALPMPQIPKAVYAPGSTALRGGHIDQLHDDSFRHLFRGQSSLPGVNQDRETTRQQLATSQSRPTRPSNLRYAGAHIESPKSFVDTVRDVLQGWGRRS